MDIVFVLKTVFIVYCASVLYKTGLDLIIIIFTAVVRV